MRQRVLALLLALLLGPALLIAQSPQKETVLIKAGKLVDVRSGRVLTDQAILIEGDRIKQVGPAQSVQAPAGARVIDLSNATVLPGLIDCHTHLTDEPGHNGYEALGISIPREALYGAKNAKLTLEARFHDRAQCGREWLFRHSSARCDQRRRCARPAHRR